MKYVEHNYEVDGKHYDSLANAEIYAKQLLMDKGVLQIAVLKNKEIIEIFYKKDGEIKYTKIKSRK